MQLNKFLAHAGVISRRKAVELIKQGLVSVNNVVVKHPAHLVTESDSVKINNKKIVLQHHIYILLNKPKGIITSTADEHRRDTILDLLDSSLKKYRLYPVGRLDRDTTGLLVITNDGDCAHRLSHPRYEISKTYVVTLDRPLEVYDYERIKEGIMLEDGQAFFDSFVYLNQSKTRLKVTLHSGKNRIIRRIFAYLGYGIKKLDRISFATITKKDLPVGRWRFLTPQEIASLKTDKKK